MRNRRNYIANREKRIEQARLWREANPEKRAEYDKNYRDRYPDRVKESAERWYETDPLAKEKKAAYAARWKAANPDKVREITRKSTAKKMEDPSFRISTNIGRALRSALPLGEKAGRRTFEILGYSKEDLMCHLEKQFQPGMTWENYGLRGWHIDHIKPKVLFQFSSTDDAAFKECWALENLQPLWAKDNLKKQATHNGSNHRAQRVAANDNHKGAYVGPISSIY